MKKSSQRRGFTLIEAVLYTTLLSGMIAILFPYAQYTKERNLELIDEINNSFSI